MTRYVIDPDVAIRLADERVAVAAGHQLVAPALLRSQVLTRLHAAAVAGERTAASAEDVLDRIRSLRIRLLGDRVLQRVAWQVADRVGWTDTFDAEYIALTTLQADALVTLDPRIERAAQGIVSIAPYAALTQSS